MLVSLLQAVPNPADFAILDSFGVPATMGLTIAVLLYLLYRSEKRCAAIDANCDDVRERYEASLAESIRDYKERDRTLELIAKASGTPRDD